MANPLEYIHWKDLSKKDRSSARRQRLTNIIDNPEATIARVLGTPLNIENNKNDWYNALRDQGALFALLQRNGLSGPEYLSNFLPPIAENVCSLELNELRKSLKKLNRELL